MEKTTSTAADSKWGNLYLAGGIAPLLALSLVLTQIVVIIVGEDFPSTPTDWLLMFERNKLLGLIYLNALDIFTIALLGTMFLALAVALRQDHAAHVVIAGLYALIGVVSFIVPRVATLSVLTLSDRYAAATNDALRAQILAAAETLSALATPTPQTVGFFFMAIAGVILSLVILQSGIFSRASAYLGIAAGGITLLNDISAVVAPTIAGILMPLNGLLWYTWWIMISLGLFKLANTQTIKE